MTAAATLGPLTFPEALGLTLGQFDRAVKAGLIPEPDSAAYRWSERVVGEVCARAAEIRAAVCGGGTGA